MNSFGLGLVLSFVDNASAGMNTATANFNRMSATADSLTSSVSASATEMAAIAFSLSAVGDTFMSIGESIMGVFTGITERVISTGGEMLNYRMQMTALYGSVEAGEAKMDEIKKYAMSSVFEIQSLIPAVTMMKAVGIEALDSITTSSGNATQRLLDYASDLAAMMPNMRNAYGTGVEAAMGAFKEYIAEGNAMSLKRGAGLDITGILGEEKGATVAERTQQVADLIEKLGIVGYTASLAGTPTQRLSNMQDALFNSLSKIADSGVFEAYCGLLETLSGWVFSLVDNEETFNAITGVLSETITALLSPLQKMLDWVVANSDAIITWIRENPKLVKNILLTVAAVGAFLIVGGSLLKLLSSIAFAMSGLNVLKSLPLLFGKMVIAVLPFVALAGLAYTAWNKNLGGIQDKITWFVNNIGDIFTILGDAWGDNTLSEDNFIKAKQLGILPFIEGILQLKYYWDFFVEGFKKGFTSFFEGLVTALGALGIDISDLGAKLIDFLDRLTQPGAEEEWVKLGEAMGAIVAMMATFALITKILMPIINAFTILGKGVSWVVKAVKALWNGFGKIALVGGAVIKFFGDMGAAIALMKEGFGFFEVMGVWFPKLAGFFTKAGALFAKFGGLFVKIGGMFTKLGGWIVAGAKAIGTAIMGVLSAIASALGISVGWVIAIIAAVIAAVALVIIFWDEISEFFVWLWGKITEFGSWFFSNIGPFFANLWSTVSTWLGNLFSKIGEWLSSVVQAIINSPFGQAVAKVMTTIYNTVAGVIKAIIDGIVKASKAIWKVIEPFISFIADIAQKAWSVISDVAIKVYNVIAGIVSAIISVIAKAGQAIWNVIQAIGSFIADIAVAAWNAISKIAISIYNCIVGVVQTIVTFIVGAAKAIWSVIEMIGAFIAGVAQVIWSVIRGVGEAIWAFIKGLGEFIANVAVGIWNVIKSVIDVIWSAIQAAGKVIMAIGETVYQFFRVIFLAILALGKVVIEGIVTAFNWLKEKATEILQAIGDFFSKIFSWINTNVIQPFVDWVVNTFNWLKERISEVINAIGDFFTGVFNWIQDTARIVITAIVDFFKWLWETIRPILQSIGDFFKYIFDWVKTNIIQPFIDWVAFAFNWIKEKIVAILTAIGDFFSSIFNWINNNVITPFRNFISAVFDWISDKANAITNGIKNAFTTAANGIKSAFTKVADFFTGIWNGISNGAKSVFNWISDKLGWISDSIGNVGDALSNIVSGAGDFLSGIGNKIANFIGLDTGGYVKTTGVAVLHPNEVVVNDDTTRRLQSFLSKYENDTVNGLVRPEAPQAILNNIYPTLMESVPVTTIPAEEISNIQNNSSFVSNTTQNIVQREPVRVVEKTGETHNDYSVTFAAGSVVIQLLNASDAELEKAAEKIMKIIARKQQLRAMAVRT